MPPVTRRLFGAAVLAGVAAAVAPLRAQEPAPARVAVSRPDGTPAAGATVVHLHNEVANHRDGWLPSDPAMATAGDDGVATFAERPATGCFLVWNGESAGLVCAARAEGDPATFRVRLGVGRRLTGVVTGGEGPVPKGARLRLRAPAGNEWHHVDIALAADGAFRSPPLPTWMLHGPAYLEALAPGTTRVEAAVDEATVLKPFRIELEPARSVRGRIVDGAGRPVVGVRVEVAAGIESGPSATSSDDGAFTLRGLGPGAVRAYALPRSHAARTVDVPSGKGDLDLGDLRVAAGRPLRGRVRETDGREVLRAIVALADESGHRIAQVEAGKGGAFEIPHVGDGRHVVDVYLHASAGIGSWRHVRRTVTPADDAVDVVVPTGLALRFVDPSGRSVTVGSCSVTLTSPDWDRPRDERFDGAEQEKGISEVRVATDGKGTARAEVHIEGRGTFVAEAIPVDENGDGAADVVVR